ncbi:hypothetical protein PVAP13_5KG153200 [Panicum virgatum]|uniref:Uncharacterized protein n=1 Tax=Panicum virgatum TaxID=38727 RepID=A0A8T0SH47_PANVG|nr:hypothetical protein PVAP13_5KG153200 [Panicum virgatum]
MPGHRTRAAARLGGVTSRRHAELLLHCGVGGVSVKDLRLRRVVPPAAGSVGSSPECTAPVKPGSAESTPPEAASAAAAAEDLDRKPLVRDPGSFGYRRLLPFLNEMAKNDNSIGKEVPSDSAAAHSKNELSRSDSRLVDEPLGATRLECEAMDSVEPVVVKTGGDTEVKDGCNNVAEEANTVPHDLASSKPWLARCTRSRFVHHPSSFSYKRMLPFLMENEISSQEGQRVKIRRVAEERLLASDENGIFTSGQQHLAFSDDSSQECSRAQVERMEEEEPPKADKNCVLDDRQSHSAVTKASPPEYNAAEEQNVLQQEALTSGQDPVTSSEGKNCVLDDKQSHSAVMKASRPEYDAAEVQNVLQQEALTSGHDPVTSSEGDLISDGDDVQASGQHQIVVSEDCPEECKRDKVKRSVQDEAVKSDGSHVLYSWEFQPAVSEISPLKTDTADMQKATQEEPSPLDGDEENSYKGDHLANEQLQPCVAKESLTAQLQDNSELAEVPQCQTKDSRCHDVGFVSPTKTMIPLLHSCCAQDPEDSVAAHDNQLLDSDIQMICRSSDPCAVDRSLSVEEMSGCIPLTESGCKAGISQPRGVHSMEKRVLSPNKYSPKKLSPKKGILKRHPRGCKGICMCLDCSTFRLHADQAFEFSRKQMQEADDIISNLLKEVANLRSLVEKPAVQQESTQAACRQASRVEEVARERCRQMFEDLNSHCRIPRPRVTFSQYVEEKKVAPSPSRSRR